MKALTKSTMKTLSEWKEHFSNYPLPDTVHADFDWFEQLSDVSTIGGYMNSPVGIYITILL